MALGLLFLDCKELSTSFLAPPRLNISKNKKRFWMGPTLWIFGK